MNTSILNNRALVSEGILNCIKPENIIKTLALARSSCIFYVVNKKKDEKPKPALFLRQHVDM